jgi:hypothetical protein
LYLLAFEKTNFDINNQLVFGTEDLAGRIGMEIKKIN